MEARVAASSLLRRDRPTPFLIYSRPRSGSTLLVRLLDQVPGVRCDGELLGSFLLSPLGMLHHLPRRAGRDCTAYGVQLLSYQVMEVHNVVRPLAFFDDLVRSGYCFLHLRRDSYGQTLSLAKAHASRKYFVGAADPEREVRVDPERFLALLGWNLRMLDYEREVMSHLPHLEVDYDLDLLDAHRHRETVTRICDFLDIPQPKSFVETSMRRTGGAEGAIRLANSEELEAAVLALSLIHI